MKEFEFDLGEVLVDVVTGLQGVVMGRTQYITGCTHYGLLAQKLDKDGKVRDWEWMDEKRLKRTGKKISFDSVSVQKVTKPSKKLGGPAPAPPSL